MFQICARMVLGRPLFYLWRSQISTGIEKIAILDGRQLIQYDCGAKRTTSLLRVYFQRASVLKVLSDAFGISPMAHWPIQLFMYANLGNIPGFFRNPLLPSTIKKLDILRLCLRDRLLEVIRGLKEFDTLQTLLGRIADILTRLYVAPSVEATRRREIELTLLEDL